jgi:cytochrome c oxidase subunit 2
MNWAPESASNFSPVVDQIASYLVWVSLLITLIVLIMMITFCWKYRQGSKADRSHYIQRPERLEFGLAALIFLFTLSVFIWSASTFYRMAMAPPEAMDVYVIGKQWMWTFQVPHHPDQINVLRVPVGKPVRLIMTSQDVIHSFYVPSFRLKQDLVPGTYTSLWFTPEKTGRFPIRCAEYCGLDHSRMDGIVEVVSQQEFEGAASVDAALQSPGGKVFQEKGCTSCHAGANPIGPRLENIFGKDVELSDGRTVRVDENYLRRSILNPHADIVKGYQPVMPTFQGQITEQELAALIDYLKNKKQ